jgi:DNA-binding CsgD family transcriptional regulator
LAASLRRGSGDTRPAGPGVTVGDKAAPAVLIFASDPGAGITADQAVLADLFGLTPAEGRLVLALLSGTSLPEFARLTGVSHNTVRTQLARAMARTDTRSQLELVLLVASSIGGTIASTARPPATPGLRTPGLQKERR